MARWNNQFPVITKSHKHKTKKKTKKKKKKKKESKQIPEHQQPVSTLLQMHKHGTCDLPYNMQKLRNIEYPHPRQNNHCNTSQKEFPKDSNQPTSLCIGRNSVPKGLQPKPTIPHQTPHQRSLLPHPTPLHLTTHNLPASPPSKKTGHCKRGSTSPLLFPGGASNSKQQWWGRLVCWYLGRLCNQKHHCGCGPDHKILLNFLWVLRVAGV